MRPTLLHCSAFLMLLPTAPLLAQDEPDHPDSLFFQALIEVTHIERIDSLGPVTAELPEVQAKLIEVQATWSGDKYALAVPAPDGYELFPIPGGWVNTVDISTVDIRGNGRPLLVVRTMNQLGHTGWENSIYETEWVVQVWDLQEHRCLLHLTNGSAFEQWSATFEPDSTGEKPYEERKMLSSDGEVSCEMTEVSFGKGTMTLVRTDDCPNLEDDEPIPVNERVTIRYKLGKDAWVKQ
jgi:hypothetical protein